MSRQQSGRGARSAASAARTPAGPRGVVVSSPKSDIYVALLAVALVAMIIGCILMVMILQRYEFKIKVASTTSTARTLVLAHDAKSAQSEIFSTVRL